MITGKDLENRAEGKRGREDMSPAARLVVLEELMKTARTLKPTGADRHCEDCFQRGRDAVLRLLGGES